MEVADLNSLLACDRSPTVAGVAQGRRIRVVKLLGGAVLTAGVPVGIGIGGALTRRRGGRSSGARNGLWPENDEAAPVGRDAPGANVHRVSTGVGRHDEGVRKERIAVELLGVDSVADRLEMIDQMERCCVCVVSSERPRWSDEDQAILYGSWVLLICEDEDNELDVMH